VGMTDRLLEARPDAVVELLDGVGHYPMIEAPARFAAAVRRGLLPATPPSTPPSARRSESRST
jgi:pimeloyl-ACP methyl ester carboxylesterase